MRFAFLLNLKDANMFSNVVCPISTERIDSYVSRLTVFLNAVLMIVFLFTLQPFLLLIVTIDYGIRAFGYKKLSPVARMAGLIMQAIRVKYKLVFPFYQKKH